MTVTEEDGSAGCQHSAHASIHESFSACCAECTGLAGRRSMTPDIRTIAIVRRASPRPREQRDSWNLFTEGGSLYEAMLKDIATAHASLFLNAAVNFVSRESRFSEMLATQFRADLQVSRAIELTQWNTRCWRHLVREALAWRVRKWL